jgi:hypothetical protein
MSERLYQLLPAIYRIRDSDEGEPLRTLLGVVEGELGRIETDIEGLYDNWFIETCAEWVVPYIGDLLGVRPLHSIDSAGVSVRSYVANTLAYRRRKGTAVVLEQLARDTTGWPARVVEFFARLATTQHVNHVRRSPVATPDVRRAASAELTETAFDPFAHTAEVRRIASGRGRYNIHNVGLFLWRLQSYRVGRGKPGDEGADFAAARRVDAPSGTYYTFHPVGLDAPLFNQPQTETTITHLAEEHNVPGRLRRLQLQAELQRLRDAEDSRPLRFLSDGAPVLRVWVEPVAGQAPVEIDRKKVYMCNLPEDVASASPPPLAVAIDPSRGRLAFPSALAPQRVFVSYSYGFSGDVGGGPYDRTDSVVAANGARRGGFFDPNVWQRGVSHQLAASDTSGLLVGTLREAVVEWNSQPRGTTGVIVIMDSVSEYDASRSPPSPLEIRIDEGSRLLIVAGGWPLDDIPGTQPPAKERKPGRIRADGVRPHFVGDLLVRGIASSSSSNPGACFLNGLLVEGSVAVANGNLGLLHIADSTIVPEAGGIAVIGGNDRLKVRLTRSICGPITVPVPIRLVEIVDSILGAESASPDVALAAESAEAMIERSTLLGAVQVQSIFASDSIFADSVHAARRQIGCVRFCYVPAGSAVPRRYRCQPDLAIAARLAATREQAEKKVVDPSMLDEEAIREETHARLKPLFESRRYGDPEYGQLERRCPREIRAGAESGSEMGAFSFLEQPQREENIRSALPEYLRFGLEAGIFFVT